MGEIKTTQTPKKLKMKISSIFALYGTSTAASVAPKEAACADGIHAHETSCNMYYQCANGHQYEDQLCPPGLMYNSEAEYCDYPDNVDCRGRNWNCYKDCVGDKWWSMITATKCSKNCYGAGSKSVAVVKSDGACEDGIHAHDTKCNSFYQCANGHQYEDQECPEGLMYNSDKEYCDYPDNVDCRRTDWNCYTSCVGDKWWSMVTAAKCSSRCYGKSVNTEAAQVEAKEAACEDGIHAHETSCDMYYQCANGHRYEDQSCPEGLVYNSDAEYCDYPENVNCHGVNWNCYTDCVDGKWWSMVRAAKCSKQCYGWNKKE